MRLPLLWGALLGLLVLLVLLPPAPAAPTTRPLEHSPGELAWDAWLQGPRQAGPSRRITTKSLFVFPHLGPESLPACADGYRPDAMGRCIKVVRVDEKAHLQFLLDKLNSQFATETSENQDEIYDYDMEAESPETGPLQVNIPIALSVKGDKREESDGSGDSSIVRKEILPKIPQPTSSPEVVPDMTDRKQFFLGDPPAAPGELLRKNDSSAAGVVSILLRNSTDSGVTLLTASNGNFENMTSHSREDLLIHELERIRNRDKDDDRPVETTTLIDRDETTDEITAETTTLEATTVDFAEENVEIEILKKIIAKPQESIGNKKPVDNRKSFVDQIEDLKKVSNSENKEDLLFADEAVKTDFKKISTDSSDSKAQAFQLETSDLTKAATDIEEKIKIISTLADVTRNTEDFHPEKKAPSNLIKFPTTSAEINKLNAELADLTSSSSYAVRPASDRTPRPSNQQPESDISSVAYHENNQPLLNLQRGSQIAGNSREKLPIWWSPSFAMDHGVDERNIKQYFSRLPQVQEYPYDVRQEHNRHPSHYQSLFPSSHESGGRLNLRHTAVNHRRGREGDHRKRQIPHEESMNYKRSRHPHFRESEELSSMLRTWNGR